MSFNFDPKVFGEAMSLAMEDYKSKTEGSKEEIIAHFESGVDKNWKLLRRINRGEVHGFGMTHNVISKPASLLERPSLAGLREISLKDFKRNHVHRGAYIRGTLCTRAQALVSLQSIFRDKDDTITYISFYNMLGQNPTPEAVDSLLPRGTEVIIVEPFLKTRADGTFGIRVDDPKDVIFGADLVLPVSPGEMAVEGSKLYKAKNYAESLICYEKALALRAKQSENILSTLLSNAALCSSKTSSEPQALLFALGASVLQAHATEGSGGGKLLCKVYARVFHALQALGGTAQELGLLSRLVRTADGKFWALSPELTAAAAASSAASVDKDDVPASILRFCVAPLLAELRASSSLEGGTSPGSSAEEDAQRAALKEQGGDKFQAAEYGDACTLYLQAARCGELAQATAATLRNAGMCLSSLGAFDRAAVLFAASLCLDARSVKSYYQLGKALLELERVDDALALCSAAKAAFPDDPASILGKLMDKIELARSVKALKPSNAARSGTADDNGRNFLGERYRAEEKKKNEADLETCKQANQMMRLLSLMSPAVREQVNIFPPVPSIHLELKKARVLPRGCDVDRCLGTLEQAYENANGLYAWLLWLTSGDESSLSEDNALDRFGPMMVLPVFQKWLTSPLRKMGDVTFDRITGCLDESHYSKNFKYDPMIQQQFSNASNRPEQMHAGKTHVAVGFVDLGSLIWAEISGDARGQPMQWVGYEASAFCVAKTLVLAEMLRDGSSTEAIFHVWFSSVWPASTLAAFLRALKTVVDGAPRLSSEVLAFLSHWSMHTTVSAAAAYRGWLETQTDKTMFPASFVRLQDRVALCRYITTGDLLGATRAGDVVGSVVMFSNPPGAGAMSLTPNFMHSVYFSLLQEEWKRPGVGDVVQAAVGLTQARIARCASLARSGKLVTRVLHRAVDVQHPAVLREISALKPYTMSWSNVPDYYHPKTFLEMARQCSALVDADNEDATVHGFYSMNWVQQTFGAHIFDIRKEKCKEVFDTGKMIYAEAVKAMGLTKYLTPMEVTNPVNTSCIPLYHQYRLAWAFFAHGEFKRSQWVVMPEVNQPLRRSDTLFFVIFCFDKMTCFNESGEVGRGERE